MTRHEEITQAAQARENVFGNSLQAFVAGAYWADRTMIDKVCEYLAQNMVCTGYTLQSKAKFIRELRKEVFNDKE